MCSYSSSKRCVHKIRMDTGMATYERTLLSQRGNRKWEQSAAMRAQLVVIVYKIKVVMNTLVKHH